MKYRCLGLFCCVLALAALATRAAERAFDLWADRFAAEWVQASPQSATRVQYFSGAEQSSISSTGCISRS